MAEIEDRVESVSDRESLARFISAFADTLEENPEDWENLDLGRFLRAWSAWLLASDGYFRGMGIEPPSQPSWSFVAQMFLAAGAYE